MCNEQELLLKKSKRNFQNYLRRILNAMIQTKQQLSDINQTFPQFFNFQNLSNKFSLFCQSLVLIGLNYSILNLIKNLNSIISHFYFKNSNSSQLFNLFWGMWTFLVLLDQHSYELISHGGTLSLDELSSMVLLLFHKNLCIPIFCAMYNL